MVTSQAQGQGQTLGQSSTGPNAAYVCLTWLPKQSVSLKMTHMLCQHPPTTQVQSSIFLLFLHGTHVVNWYT